MQDAIARTLEKTADEDFDRALLHFVVAGDDTQAGQAPGGARYEPVRALMRAMLQDAILCLLGEAAGVAAAARPRLALEAHQWVNSPSHNWVFSFENVCNVLGFDKSSVRQRLMALVAARRDGTPSLRGHVDDAVGVRHLRKSRERRSRRMLPRRRRSRSISAAVA